MDNDLKEIVHTEINKIVDIFTPKPKKTDYKLMVFWVIVGFLAVILLCYTYKMLFVYF